jgi:GNAT superfamily N-acetyltransferase
VQDPHIDELDGAELDPWLDGLGELRIRVFREYPYLYDGTLEYERAYLQTYRDARDARVVLVTDGSGAVVAATTCVPLVHEGPEFQAPFLATGIDPATVLYLGESIALPAWRGKGLGEEFFVRREAHARRLGLTTAAFCAVDRPADHPLRPADYRPLDSFWQSRGYVKRPGMRAVFRWKEICEAEESPKTLTFWLKSWTH